MRLDKFIAEHYECTRNRAQFFIDQALVLVNNNNDKKASYDTKKDDAIELIQDRSTIFVSRSAIKLDDFLENIPLDILNAHCLDIGASTGGFTQVLLMRGAKSVHAVDVGTLQLHPLIRSDIRVTSIENTDIRNYRSKSKFDIIVGDISFISLTKLVDSIISFASFGTEIILLYKPQFEVGPENLRKTGVPKSDTVVTKKFKEFQEFLIGKELTIKKIVPSSLLGESGNQEYILWIQKKESD